MSLLGLVNSLAGKKPEVFVAPVPFAEQVSVRTIQDSVPYTFKVRNPHPGWWYLIPDNRMARVDKPAEPARIIEYLEQLPRFYVIALFPTSETTWLVSPYSIADANQRGWKNGEPREVQLVRHAIQPFDVLVTRSIAGVLLFDDVDTRLGASTLTRSMLEAVNGEGRSTSEVNWRNAYQLVYDRTQKVLDEQRKTEYLKRVQSEQMQAEESIRWHLEFMGASLMDFRDYQNGFDVTWKAPDGRVYDMRVGKNMRIEVAGLCLNGTDRIHNLSSIVHTMEEAVRLRRPDLPGEERDYDDD